MRQNPSELKQALNDLQAALDSHEKINIAVLNHKLSKASDAYPHDKTIGQVSLVIDRLNDNNQFSISRAELKDLYRRLYSNDTKFEALFASELGAVEDATKPVPSEYQRPTDGQELNIYEGADQELSSQLSASFGTQAHSYDPKTAQEAEKVVELECSFKDLSPEVKAVSGDEGCVVVSASYSTSKGKATFYVPVEVINKRASTPSFFTGKDGTHYISQASVEKYVMNYFNSPNSYNNVKIAQDLKIETPKDLEIEQAVEKFDSPVGLATVEHGEKVEAGRSLIANKLASFGYRHSQVSVLDSDKKSITYGVRLDRVAFKVPVKVTNDRIQEPTVLLCNGTLEPLTFDGVKNLTDKDFTDTKVSSVISPLTHLRAHELIEKVQEGVATENYLLAEDALNVLAHSGDKAAYQTALSEYSSKLTGKQAENTKTCSRVIKASTSTQPVCGHLNLPMNKVYQDKTGNCRPISRKGYEEQTETGMFSNSKIFV